MGIQYTSMNQVQLEYRQYYLDGGGFIPIFIIKLPNTHAEISANGYDYVAFKFRPQLTNWTQGTLPFWVSKSEFGPRQFKESYKDEFINVQVLDSDSFGVEFLDEKGNKLSQSIIGLGNPTGTIQTIGVVSCFCALSSDNYIYTRYSSAYGDDTCQFIKCGLFTESSEGYLDIREPIEPGKTKGQFLYTREFSISGDFKASYMSSAQRKRAEEFLNITRTIDNNDPNDGGGSSQGGGGGGGSDIGGDTNSDDGVPTIEATDSGLMRLYNPTTAELQTLGKFLWSDKWSLDNFKKLFNDPFDTLLGLSVIPIKPNISGTSNIMFGNLDSGVSASVVGSQWVSKDMGSITLNEVWKGALDYSPSTACSIYLPFIGMRQLNINDVMGTTIHLIYKFDVLTGTCIAQLYLNHNAQGNKSKNGFSYNPNQGFVYEFIGQCSTNIPLSSQDYTNTIRAAIGAVGMAAGAAASVATGNPALGVASLTVGAANAGMQANTPTVERSGHLSGSAAILGYTKPFLVVERPHQCKPSRYYALRGIPSQVYTDKLANCTGFTQITDNNNIHASGAQDTELEEIERLLSSGVYFPNKAR